MEEKVLEYLDELVESSLIKNVYVIEYKGVRLKMTSGKSSWVTIGAAKNALRNDLCTAQWKRRWDRIEGTTVTLRDLEERGIIKYIKL